MRFRRQKASNTPTFDHLVKVMETVEGNTNILKSVANTLENMTSNMELMEARIAMLESEASNG